MFKTLRKLLSKPSFKVAKVTPVPKLDLAPRRLFASLVSETDKQPWNGSSTEGRLREKFIREAEQDIGKALKREGSWPKRYPGQRRTAGKVDAPRTRDRRMRPM